MTSIFPAITSWGVALGFLSALLLLLGSIGTLFKKKLMNTASLIVAIVSGIFAMIIAGITGINVFYTFYNSQKEILNKELIIPLPDDGHALTIHIDYLNNNFSKEEDCIIHPLLVQRNYSETCWTKIPQDELKQNIEFQQMIAKAKKDGIDEITVYKTVCFYQENGNWDGKHYKETTFQDLFQEINDSGYSLPTKREWEYLAGKGCRSIFPWGNNMDFSMNLRHIEWLESDGDYPLEKENFFGLHIAYDPYCREIVSDNSICNGE